MSDSLSNEELLRHLCGDSACKNKGTYTVKAVCANCDWAGTVELTKGHGWLSHLIACPNCACTSTLMRRPS